MCESSRTLANFHAYPRILSRTSANSCVSAREPPRICRELSRTSRIRRELSYMCICAIYANMDRELSRIRRELLENFRVSARVFAYLSRTFANFRVFVANFCVSARVFSRIRRVFSRTVRELSRTLAYNALIYPCKGPVYSVLTMYMHWRT